MIEKQLTSNEIDFLIYISRFQDENGRVEGVHYKDVCETMGISYQGFYDIKNSLMEKGIILIEKNNRIDHDITIIGNSFEGVQTFESYINTNHNIFYDEEFFALKAGSKLLAMEMMKRTFAGKGNTVIGKKNFYEKYCEMFQVSKRVMRTYLMQIKKFFSIELKDGKYYIKPLTKIYRNHTTTENERYAKHKIRMICRRKRMNLTDDKAIADTAGLAAQYREYARIAGKEIWNVIQEAISQSLDKLNESCKTHSIRDVKPKLIHKFIKESLALA